MEKILDYKVRTIRLVYDGSAWDSYLDGDLFEQGVTLESYGYEWIGDTPPQAGDYIEFAVENPIDDTTGGTVDIRAYSIPPDLATRRSISYLDKVITVDVKEICDFLRECGIIYFDQSKSYFAYEGDEVKFYAYTDTCGYTQSDLYDRSGIDVSTITAWSIETRMSLIVDNGTRETLVPKPTVWDGNKFLSGSGIWQSVSAVVRFTDADYTGYNAEHTLYQYSEVYKNPSLAYVEGDIEKLDTSYTSDEAAQLDTDIYIDIDTDNGIERHYYHLAEVSSIGRLDIDQESNIVSAHVFDGETNGLVPKDANLVRAEYYYEQTTAEQGRYYQNVDASMVSRTYDSAEYDISTLPEYGVFIDMETGNILHYILKSRNVTLTKRYLDNEGEWSVPQGTIYNVFTPTEDGLVPAPQEVTSTKVLMSDGQWRELSSVINGILRIGIDQ